MKGIHELLSTANLRSSDIHITVDFPYAKSVHV